MPFPRASGILLHPTSFPSRFGIGDLGTEAYRFIDFLAASGQQIWQILPLGPTAYGDSPYQCFSAIAGNPMLISPEILCGKGLLTEEDFNDFPELPLRVDFGWVIHVKTLLLRKASDNFKVQATPEWHQAFEEFCQGAADWLDDYALFRAVKDAHGGASWNTWDETIAHRKPEALEQWQQQLVPQVFFHKFLQFEFAQQWADVKRYANEKGIQILGDLPIYVAHDSAEVWAHPEYFCLDSELGTPSLMAGVPPDYFSPTGQLWGNPIYDWERLQQDNFKWWVQRFQAMLDCVDLIRIDHFRGFESYWAIKGGETTAMDGEWMVAPGEALFQVLAEQLGVLPIIAEDLGFITPEVEALRDQFEFPGMKILQFAFDSDAANPYLPFHYLANTVVYTGTHDNDTTVGWFNARSSEEQHKVWRYLGCGDTQEIHWELVRLAFSSVSNQAIVPLQDILGLDTRSRMNAPGQAIGNWGWRYEQGALTAEVGDRLRDLTELYGRSRQPHLHS
ncbi:MAG: 4-alpha-glucanotransferase [Drouetiella hepatica Uher 2000/2452]|jgi:4-alpha-glucanotransferase|uniref:4-alpha-glucanotransferase n=1 Tax=Drouetiella hepatica Uher 2000/2452 TaxID=904376 RepID=A0A951Q8X6_9CYAN|nr:4-alpha-glucanotransferase [Drouetiella hepatica Uher 2000/2452]